MDTARNARMYLANISLQPFSCEFVDYPGKVILADTEAELEEKASVALSEYIRIEDKQPMSYLVAERDGLVDRFKYQRYFRYFES